MYSTGIGRSLLLSCALAAAWGIPRPATAQEAEPVERPVTFSAQQSDSGRSAYLRYCVECHGDNLNDGEFGGPPLSGARFEQTFGALPVSALYNYILAAMPPDRPGRISHADRTDIVAYILDRNGYRDGNPISDDVEAMDYLIVEK